MKKIIILIAIGLLYLSTDTNAQRAYIGPQVGFFKAKDGDNTNIYGGGALRLKLSPTFGVEGSIGFRQEKYAEDAITVKSWPINVTGMLYLVPALYGAIGFGWYNTTIEVNAGKIAGMQEDFSKTKQKVGWHFGPGVEIPIGTASILTADIRYVFLDYDFDAVPGVDINNNFYIITAGLMFGL